MTEQNSKFQKLEKLKAKTDDEETILAYKVDITNKRFYLYSDKGNQKVINCDTIDEFINVLGFIKEFSPEFFNDWTFSS